MLTYFREKAPLVSLVTLSGVVEKIVSLFSSRTLSVPSWGISEVAKPARYNPLSIRSLGFLKRKGVEEDEGEAHQEIVALLEDRKVI